MNVAFQRHRMRRNLLLEGSPLTVIWCEESGGFVDEPTGATISGTRTVLSGTLHGFVQEEPARSVVRQFGEIQTGDLIVDVLPDAEVSLFEGQTQSGTVALTALDEPRFALHGRQYSQAKVGGELDALWDATLGGEKMERTLLLRRAT